MGRNTLKARLSRTGFWFCLPQLIGFLFVFLCPLALCIYYSMTAKSGGFSGLANYRDLWTSGTFRLALGNTFRFSAAGVFLLVGISFLLSVGFHHLLLYSSRKIKWMQSGLITPMVIPSAVIILFCQIFLDAGGVLNQWTGSKTFALATLSPPNQANRPKAPAPKRFLQKPCRRRNSKRRRPGADKS